MARSSFNGRQILAPAKQGSYSNFYYAQGHLFFYHRFRADQGSFTRIYACPWTPKMKKPIDLQQATVLKTPYEQETPFSFGQFKNEVLTVSNMGGVYIFNGSNWRTLLAPDNTVSYQVYSMLNYYDRLLLAQYPTGNLIEYRDGKLKHLKGWPPRLPGVAANAREAQTTAIYRGDLFVGVWPWAELWRYNRDEEKWHSMGRMFSHPEITDKTTHPYEAAANELKLVTNHWGQRVTGLIPLHDRLMLSTSSKGTGLWQERFKFLDETQRREYGAVLQLNMPGNLATTIQWQEKPMQFEFLIQENQMIIRQDGQTLATTAAPAPDHWQEMDYPLAGRCFRTSQRAATEQGSRGFERVVFAILRLLLANAEQFLIHPNKELSLGSNNAGANRIIGWLIHPVFTDDLTVFCIHHDHVTGEVDNIDLAVCHQGRRFVLERTGRTHGPFGFATLGSTRERLLRTSLRTKKSPSANAGVGTSDVRSRVSLLVQAIDLSPSSPDPPVLMA